MFTRADDFEWVEAEWYLAMLAQGRDSNELNLSLAMWRKWRKAELRQARKIARLERRIGKRQVEAWQRREQTDGAQESFEDSD